MSGIIRHTHVGGRMKEWNCLLESQHEAGYDIFDSDIANGGFASALMEG